MNTSIFIRSYRNDFRWLDYCLRSIQKYAVGFSEVIIAVPENDVPLLSHLTVETVIGVHDAQPGYLCQQSDKLNADRHTKAEYILCMDSDVCFAKPVTPESFMSGDKVRWLMTPWEQCMDAKKAWAHVMVKLTGEMPTHDFMRKSTIMVPRWAYAAFRSYIEATQGMSMESYVMSQPGREFSEYNTLGFYLWLHHRDKIAFHDTAIHGVPDIGERQFWSWSGLTDGERKEIEGLLA